MRIPFNFPTTAALAAGSDADNEVEPSTKPMVAYPETQQIPEVDAYFNTSITDPYRWLEDDHSAATKAWVDAQNAVAFGYWKELPRRKELRGRLGRLLDYERESARFEEGGYTYFYRNTGLQNQSVIYQTDKSGVERVFLDPNALSPDGTTSVSSLSFSPSAKLAAYQKSKGGAG